MIIIERLDKILIKINKIYEDIYMAVKYQLIKYILILC